MPETRYRAKPSICNACEIKVRCITSEHGRVPYRAFEEDSCVRVRGCRRTFAYEKALRKRKVEVEPASICYVSACSVQLEFC